MPLGQRQEEIALAFERDAVVEIAGRHRRDDFLQFGFRGDFLRAVEPLEHRAEAAAGVVLHRAHDRLHRAAADHFLARHDIREAFDHAAQYGRFARHRLEARAHELAGIEARQFLAERLLRARQHARGGGIHEDDLHVVVGAHHVGVEAIQRAAERRVQQRFLTLLGDVVQIGDDLERLAGGVDDRIEHALEPDLALVTRHHAELALAALAALQRLPQSLVGGRVLESTNIE